MSEPETRLVVGVEVHVQLATATKLFCACPVEFGAEPNTLCCPICLGHPGALPVLNRVAVELSLRAGAALGCELVPQGATQWDRKNYFYPDLPKGYQITQYERPLCENGALLLSDGTKVRIRRAHLEEDTGKSSHAADGATLIDFNRCGTPLLEIVTEPDLRTAAQVEEYLRRLQERLRAIGAGECSMEKGQMRCEPNVNLVRGDRATPISELKNLNSFVSCRDAVAYEAARLAEGEWLTRHAPLPRATLGWDAAAGRSVPQRVKETAADYRYFPEPDLPVLPAAALERMMKLAATAVREADEAQAAARDAARDAARHYGLEGDAARLLIEEDVTGGRWAAAVAAVVDEGVDPAAAGPALAAWFTGPLAGWVNERGGDWSALAVSAEEFAAAAALLRDGEVTAQVVKQHLLGGDWPGTGGDPKELLGSKGLLGGTGEDAVRTACQEVLAANPDIVAKIREGKGAAKGALVGQVMKKTRGTADPKTVNAVLDELLAG